MRRATGTRGFTLIEILVTLCIIGVLAATLMLVATPGEATATRTEARRLAALLELALAEARASGAPIAWGCFNSSQLLTPFIQ